MITQYSYTYIIRYQYTEEQKPRYYNHCSDNYSLSDDEANFLKEYLLIEDGDAFEVVWQVANDFNGDECLSDGVRHSLNSTDLPQGYAEAHAAYIGFISSNLFGEEKNEYKKLIVSAILKYLKAKDLNKPLIKLILSYFGEDIKDKGGVMAQLRKIADERYDEKILLRLTTPNKVSNLRYWLDKMEACFKLREETSQGRIAVIIYAFGQYTQLIYEPLKNNLKKLMTLVCEYYGIDAPTYRLNDIRNYTDPKTKKNLLKHIHDEHKSQFWDRLP